MAHIKYYRYASPHLTDYSYSKSNPKNYSKAVQVTISNLHLSVTASNPRVRTVM